MEHHADKLQQLVFCDRSKRQVGRSWSSEPVSRTVTRVHSTRINYSLDESWKALYKGNLRFACAMAGNIFETSTPEIDVQHFPTPGSEAIVLPTVELLVVLLQALKTEYGQLFVRRLLNEQGWLPRHLQDMFGADTCRLALSLCRVRIRHKHGALLPPASSCIQVGFCRRRGAGRRRAEAVRSGEVPESLTVAGPQSKSRRAAFPPPPPAGQGFAF